MTSIVSPGSRCLLAGVLAGLVVHGGAVVASAQSPKPGVEPAAEASIAGPEAQVFVHGQDGRVTVRATRVTTPLKIDGRLDEDVYRRVPPITAFIQSEPVSGAPTTERTEAWVLFDDRNLYFACRCWDTQPDRIVANDMRRDSSNLPRHDNFAVAIDTFNDGRNGVFFFLTAIGAMRDAAVTDQRPNLDWNPVWDGKVSRFANGWIAEMAFPFKSLRYGPGRQQAWRIQLRRAIRSKNEVTYLTLMNPQWGTSGISHMSEAVPLVGIEAPPASRMVEIKPYAISRLTTDLLRSPAVRNHGEADAGVDVKMGVTKGLTADFTYNTDFAQVEADEAQVNLARFNLSFPEKREFFLEGQGVFDFGTGGGYGISARGGDTGDPSDAPVLFYSRRIGIASLGQAVPVIGGGRLSGKAGPWGAGALAITTAEDEATGTPQTTFNVVRLKHDILSKSMVGGILSRRSAALSAPGANSLWGLDANLAFFQNLMLGGYVAHTRTEGLRGNDLAYRGLLNYNADRYGVAIDRLVVGEHFKPDMGFLRRENFQRNLVQGRFSPRTKHHPLIRKVSYEGGFEYTTDNRHRLESREARASLRLDFHNADTISAQHSRLYERLPAPFQIARNVLLPAGGYEFQNTRLFVGPGVNHRVTGTAMLDAGSFYGGTKRAAGFRGRVDVTPRFGLEPNLSFSWIDVPQGAFTDTVVGGRATFSMSPRSFVASLVQYSSANAAVSVNLRLRWEYQPGSELFVVYTEGRTTLAEHGPSLEGRGLVVKVNRLFRF